MAFAGTEIINVSRTWAYVQQAMPTFGLQDCYGCRDDLRAALGHDKYESVLVDQPDWFDPRNPDSWRFYGLWPLAVDGFEDAVREATVTQLMTDGAAITAPRQQGREMTVSALLIGQDDAAISYGLSWLRFALFGSACRDSLSCTGDHLCWFSACPPMCEDSPAWPGQGTQIMLCEEGLVTSPARSCTLPYERTFYEVTVTEGPVIADRYDTVCGSMVRVEWTMVAAVPWAYSTGLVTADTDDSPIQVIPNVDCTAGSKVVRRTNRFLNPIPLNAGGWNSHDTAGYPATRDTTTSRLPGRASVKQTVTVPGQVPNLATNPVPSGNLDGWGFVTPQDASTRTNLAFNPQPLEAGGGTWEITGQDPAPDPQWHDDEAGFEGPGFVRFINPEDATGDPVVRVAAADTPRAGTFTASAYLRPSADMIVVPQIEGGDAGASTYLPGGVWTRISATAVLDPGANPQVVLLAAITDAATFAAGETLDVSGLLVETGSVAGEFFDGWTTSDDAHQNTWDGAEGPSTSTQTWPASTVTTTLGSGSGPNATTSYQHNVVGVAQVRGGGGPAYTLARSVAAGDVYTASLWVRASTRTTMQLVVQGLAADGTVAFTQTGDPVVPSAGAWTLLGPVSVVATHAANRLVVRAVQTAAALPVERTNLATDPEMSTTSPQGWAVSSATSTGATIAGTRVAGATDGPLAWVSGYGRGTVTADTATPGAIDTITVTLMAQAQAAAVHSGAVVSVSAMVRSSVASSAVQLTAAWYDASGTALSQGPIGAPVAAPAGGWVRVAAAPVAAPPGAARVVVSAQYQYTGDRPAVGATADVTALLIEETGTVGDYFSGNRPSDFDWSYRWTGTLGASTSTATAQAPAAIPTGGSLDAGSVTILAGQSTTSPLLGQVDHIGQTGTTNTQLAVSAGVTYTASLYVRPSRPGAAQVLLLWYTSAGVQVGATVRGAVTPAAANAWTRIHVTAQAPATAAYVHIAAIANVVGVGESAGARVGDMVRWGDALLEQSPSVLSYFDGSMA